MRRSSRGCTRAEGRAASSRRPRPVCHGWRLGRRPVGVRHAHRMAAPPDRAAQPARPVDVQPGAPRGARIGDRVQRIAGAGVDVARLRADDRRAVAGGGQRLRQRPGPDRAVAVDRDACDTRLTHPDQPQRPSAGDVRLVADEDLARGCAEQPVARAFQPSRASTAPRAAARHVMLPICAPVTNPTAAGGVRSASAAPRGLLWFRSHTRPSGSVSLRSAGWSGYG